MYEAIQQRIADYDREILRQLAAMQRADMGDQPPESEEPAKSQSHQETG
jgi:hypothetical protein